MAYGGGVVTMDFFAAGSPYLSHPLLTTERTELEVDRLIELLGATPDRVLDAGCGFGRHSLALAGRGATVTALDPSPTMLEAAAAGAERQGLTSIDFVEATIATMEMDRSFDAVLCLFTSFGQLASDTASSDDDEFGCQLRQLYEVTAPGGAIVLEVPDRDKLASALVEQEQLGPTAVRRTLDQASGVVRESFAGPERTHELAYRAFRTEELLSMVAGAGFVEARHLDHALVEPPFTMMTIMARRPANGALAPNQQ